MTTSGIMSPQKRDKKKSIEIHTDGCLVVLTDDCPSFLGNCGLHEARRFEDGSVYATALPSMPESMYRIDGERRQAMWMLNQGGLRPRTPTASYKA